MRILVPALLVSGLLFSALPALGQADRFVVEDIFGRTLNSRGITLVDWEGYLANPAKKLFLRPPSGAGFPLQASLSANGPRLYFDQPSACGAAGPTKTVSFESASDRKPVLISIFPDRDMFPEEYALKIAWKGPGGATAIQTVPIEVVDQDQDREPRFDILVDFSEDQTGFFDRPARRDIILQAARDWAYFIDDMKLDQTGSGAETTWIWNKDGFNSGHQRSNRFPYTGFLLYVYGIHHDALRSGGEPSAAGGFQTSGGTELPLKRSGGVETETQGNYNSLGWFLTEGDDDWWVSRNASGEPNDFYSIVRHEMGHALFFETHYPKFAEYVAAGSIRDERVYAYHGAYPKMDSSSHFPGEVDRASGKGMFGNEYHGYGGSGMPLGRWLITKLDLLCAQAIGYKVKRTSALIPLSVAKGGFPEGRVETPYSGKLKTDGGIPAYSWSLESGELPQGMSLNSFTGEISGVPARSGVSFFSLRFRDDDESSSGILASRSLTVDPATGNGFRIISPNGGEVWTAGSVQTIVWDAPDDVAGVRIDLTTDGGRTFQSVAASAPNSGRFAWQVPDGAAPACFVRVSDVRGELADASDGAFTIYQPLYPPMNFRGERRENRSLFLREYINALAWDPDPRNRDVAKYRIYRILDGARSLPAEVDAAAREYRDRPVAANETRVYEIVSVNSAGEESSGVSLTIR
ncbi:MAG: Ig domain-containing protein [Candidatus Aminicenantales bacterium]